MNQITASLKANAPQVRAAGSAAVASASVVTLVSPSGYAFLVTGVICILAGVTTFFSR